MERKFTLSCCSTVDLPYSYMESRDIPVLFYTYVVDGQTYDDDMGRDPAALPRFYGFLKAGKLPQTSQINVAGYMDFFERLLQKGGDVLHIAFTSGQSCSVNNAYLAAEELKDKYPGQKLIVIDSLCSSSGYGLLVDYAADMRDAGEDIDTVAQWVLDNRNKVHHQFFSSDMTQFRRTGRVSGAGFYYLLGDIARLHEGVLAYARDFMIDKGFTFCIPPFMIHGNVVEGVMSQNDMDAMMYKIEGEDLYLIGTSEHSMVGRFIGEILPESSLPQTLTSYSPCFRKEKGSHGIEERGVYRIHQFEKQEMIVVCKPEDSMDWYNRMWKWSVELFRSMDIPVRQLECCSGDLADLKVKSCDIEAWSPRQKKYFEVCSCSNLGDAQARRLKIRVKGEDGKMYLPHTLNNTVVAPPRMLIAFLENNLQADGSVLIPKVLQPYMGGKTVLIPKK